MHLSKNNQNSCFFNARKALKIEFSTEEAENNQMSCFWKMQKRSQNSEVEQ